MNLKLITTETFGELPCNFYRNMNDDILLTREQIGMALDYADPSDSIYRIHKRHYDRLANLSVCISDGQGHDVYYYNERGIMEICRWSRQPKANAFMDWTWDIIEKYRHGELQSQDVTKTLETISNITNTMNSLTATLSALTCTVSTMQQEIHELKTPKSKPEKQKKFSYWSTKMFPKYQLLADYFNITNKKLYSNLYNEFQNMYPDIDLNQLSDDYCCKNNMDSCYMLDAIEHNLEIRKLFESMVDNLLLQYDLFQKQSIRQPYITIFNRA